jgi:PPOX class probable F420-dependent enzyme
MIDLTSDFGKRAARRLMEEEIIWLTTTDKNGSPQPRPVWFLWDGETILIFSQPQAHKVSHIKNHARVALNLDSVDFGEDIVVILGDASISTSPVTEDEMAKYIEKYTRGLERINFTTEEFKSDYNLAIRITPIALRGI